MAERRMFTQKIVDSDAFLDMPLSTQCLYFHLNMRADDDGFVNNPRKIQRMIGASDDDLKLLIAKRFIFGFESGVIVIKHWRMHNLIRKDRYHPSQYQEELMTLGIKDNGSYTEAGNQLATTWQPVGNQLATEVSIGKDRIGKDRIDYAGEFIPIWKMYPRKQGKDNAYKAFVKARKAGETVEAITDGLKAYLKYIEAEKVEPKFIKQGSTWFNQHCWNDDYSVIAPDSYKKQRAEEARQKAKEEEERIIAEWEQEARQKAKGTGGNKEYLNKVMDQLRRGHDIS